jgi:Na+/proline symporter
MFCNWQFIAPKVRVATEKYNSLTFFSYLEAHFGDRSGALRIFTTIICFAFYTIYISAGLVGLGLLVESLFPISYHVAIALAILIAVPYLLIGGYKTLVLLSQVGGWEGISQAAIANQISLKPLSDFSLSSIIGTLLVMLGWGLGYFGQPAIITKFMGIKDVSKISKSKYVGMGWMVLSLAAATFVGLIGIAFFNGASLDNPEMLFITIVKNSFSPFLIGIMLCAIFAASINVMCSQILVLCSSLAEDVYKKIFRIDASSKELLLVSRLGVVFVALISFAIAYFKISSIYSLVLYAWSGLGSAFGPLLIFSLYSKKRDKKIAWAALISGSVASAVWPLLAPYMPFPVDPIIIGFAASFLAIFLTASRSRIPEEALSP